MEEMDQKFNELIKQFIGKDKIEEPDAQDLQDTIVEAVEEISTVETIVQPVVEPEVDETTTLSEILETPVS